MFRQQKPFIRYQHDALDRLTSHWHPDNLERQRFYCKSQLVTEIHGGEQFSVFQHEDQLLAQHVQGDGCDSTLLATDQQRSVLHVLNSNYQRSIAYSAYGHRPFESGLTRLLGFNGQRPEPVTGHYLLGNGYRAFNPVLMRFNSPDSLSPFGEGGINSYAYCAGDPVNRNDPTGHVFSKIANLFSKPPKYLIDNATGVQLKLVKKITRLSEGVVVFQDKYKGGTRLTFQAHGNATGGAIGRGNGQDLVPLELIKLAESHGVSVEKFDSYRVVACYSGDKGNHLVSFAEGLHDLLGRPVKGYEGMVGVAESSLAYPVLAIGETYNDVHYFGIGKKLIKDSMHRPNYRPVTFGNINKVRKSIRK